MRLIRRSSLVEARANSWSAHLAMCLADGVRVGELEPVEETALLTLYCRALDNRRPDPILGDSLADEVAAKLDYDFAGLGVMGSTERFVALRAKMLDTRIRAFTEVYPNAVVVDLGAGLSSAVFRVDPPTTVDWYSVDLPAVITLRDAVLPRRGQAHSVAASLTEPTWAEAIPGDRPAMVIADGLFAFLSEPTLVAVFRGISAHFDSGVLAFYDYGKVSPVSRLMGRALPNRKRMTRLLSSVWAFDGFTDAHHPETWNPSLQLIEEVSAMHEPDLAAFPPIWRLAAGASTRIPAIARKARVLSYRF
jgi:O-methyltransferase involved in polyketide biosynthesis